MSAIQLINEEIGFHSAEVHLLASIKYWGLLWEAKQSESYSRLRKRFINDEAKAQMQQRYSQEKVSWTKQWYDMTSRLLEIDTPIPMEQLHQKLIDSSLNQAQKTAICVELATFSPYCQLDKESSQWANLRFDELDRKLYLGFCSRFMDEERYTMELAYKEFNRCNEIIAKAVLGPDYTLMWVGFGAALLMILAPYLAGVIGGLMGLSGAAATSAGLALLGGGSLAAGGFGMSGGYVVLMAGGAILGYGSGSVQYQQKLREGSKEELIFNCGKLYAALKVFSLYADKKLNICGQVLRIQADLETEADGEFLEGNVEKGKQLDNKALVMRSFRRLLRGDLQ
jgi:hypothetical protein